MNLQPQTVSPVTVLTPAVVDQSTLILYSFVCKHWHHEVSFEGCLWSSLGVNGEVMCTLFNHPQLGAVLMDGVGKVVTTTLVLLQRLGEMQVECVYMSIADSLLVQLL